MIDLSNVPFIPYFQDEHSVIYNADCALVLPTLPTFRLLLTDPPYGIGASSGTGKYGRLKFSDIDPKWDDATPLPDCFSAMLELAIDCIIWGANYFHLPRSRNFVVWDKGAGFRGRDFAECEQAWCSWDGNAKVYSRDPLACGDYRRKVHPTQKPIALMQWCLGLVPDANTILDPFMGSGTTLIAAKLEGRFAVGIEINEKYCEIAAKRLAQGVLF